MSRRAAYQPRKMAPVDPARLTEAQHAFLVEARSGVDGRLYVHGSGRRQMAERLRLAFLGEFRWGTFTINAAGLRAIAHDKPEKTS